MHVIVVQSQVLAIVKYMGDVTELYSILWHDSGRQLAVQFVAIENTQERITIYLFRQYLDSPCHWINGV
jgi:hypothetical protein